LGIDEDMIIHKADLVNYPNIREDLFGLKSPARLYQTFSGIYNFDTIIKIIDGYKPAKIIAYCNRMHASTIVKIICTLQMRKYRLRLHRVIITDSPSPTITTMILRFYLLESPSSFAHK
jgi:hypothetical protein